MSNKRIESEQIFSAGELVLHIYKFSREVLERKPEKVSKARKRRMRRRRLEEQMRFASGYLLQPDQPKEQVQEEEECSLYGMIRPC